jgi:hypothetical protein
MKKLIAFSSVLALVLVSSGLFAYDILNSEGEKSWFSVNMEARYGLNIDTPAPNAGTAYDPEPTVIYENFDDRQERVSIGVSYDGDLYAFGLAARWDRRWTDTDPFPGMDVAWGKFYFMDKQLWLRAGALTRAWGLDTDPLNYNYADAKGFQLNFAPTSVNGLNVGVALPVPSNGARRTILKGIDAVGDPWDGTSYAKAVGAVTAQWGPSYPFANMRFGLRLNGTIPNLDFGTELKLNGLADTNGKVDTTTRKPLEDEAEGDFKGMDFHLTAVYTFAPITVKAAVLATGIADGREKAADPLLSIGAQIGVAIPEVAPNLSLGSPWVRLVMAPVDISSGDSKKGRNTSRPSDDQLTQESLQDMHISFEWEPSYSIVPDKVKALLWLGVYYSSLVKPTADEEDYPIEVAVQPKVEFKFAPNATLSIFDKVTFAQKAVKEGFKNTLGLRISLGF